MFYIKLSLFKLQYNYYLLTGYFLINIPDNFAAFKIFILRYTSLIHLMLYFCLEFPIFWHYNHSFFFAFTTCVFALPFIYNHWLIFFFLILVTCVINSIKLDCFCIGEFNLFALQKVIFVLIPIQFYFNFFIISVSVFYAFLLPLAWTSCFMLCLFCVAFQLPTTNNLKIVICVSIY